MPVGRPPIPKLSLFRIAVVAGLGTLLLAACSTVRQPAPVTPPPVAPPHPVAPPAPTPTAPSHVAGTSDAARYNAAAEYDLVFAPFGRPENGWAIYAPLIAESMGVADPPDSDAFALAVGRWQTAHGLPGDGAVTAETFQTFKGVWQENRPFVMLRVAKVCPAAAAPASLEALSPEEIFGDKMVMLRATTLASLRRMIAAAKQEVAETTDNPDLLKVFSGYRDPAADDARCKAEHNCQGMVRAACSAHRTGLAVDLNVGFAPGFLADSSEDPNRLHQSQTETYRWLVHNAARFGFVNYAFEPWHWEWTGEAP